MSQKRNLKDEEDYNSIDEDEPKIQKKNKGTAAVNKQLSKSKSRDDSDDDDIPLYRDDDEEEDKSSKKKTSQSKDTKSKPKEEKPKPKSSKNDRKRLTADGDVEIEYIKDDEIMFHLQTKKKVVLSKFKNQVLISIREYFEKNGDILPTKKGVSLTKDAWDKLKACINDIDEQIKNLS